MLNHVRDDAVQQILRSLLIRQDLHLRATSGEVDLDVWASCPNRQRQTGTAWGLGEIACVGEIVFVSSSAGDKIRL